MRNLTKAISMAAAAAVLLSACSKDPDSGGEPFSQKSVEENKQIVENSAISMAATMDEMKDLESADAAVNLGTLFDMADPLAAKSKKSTKVSATINVIAGLKDGSSTPADVLGVMKSAGELNEDPETLQEAWDEVVGIYEWNASAENWDYSAASDKVVFMFPSTDGGTENDATLTISDYSSVQIANPIDEEYDGDLPTALKMNLMVGMDELISFSYSASYNDDGIPSSVSASLTIEDFVYSAEASSSNTSVSASYSLMKGSTTILAISGSASGDFTESNIDKNAESENPEEIVHSGSATWQMYDIALKGDVNIKELVKEADAAWPDGYWEDENFDYKAAAQKEADAINKHLNLRAVNVTAGEKIAEVEAYVVEETYGEWTDYWTDLRLKFGDGSYVDFETYFEEGFEDVVGDINEMIAELNSEYDWDLEEIDY